MPSMKDRRHRHWNTLRDQFAELAVNRRQFLQTLTASSVALATGAGCRWRANSTNQKWAAPVADEFSSTDLFCSAHEKNGFFEEILIETFDGRPIKVDSFGGRGTTVQAQASVLDLYHPARLKQPRNIQPEQFLQSWRGRAIANRGAGSVLRLTPIASPLQNHLLDELVNKMPALQLIADPSPGSWSYLGGTELLFGEKLWPVYDLKQADLIIGFDADLFGELAGQTAYARQWAERRTPKNMNRLIAFSSVPNTTSAVADHHFPWPAKDIEKLIWHLAYSAYPDRLPKPPTGLNEEQLRVQEKIETEKRILLVPGTTLPEEFQALVFLLNYKYNSPAISYREDPFQSTELPWQDETTATTLLNFSPHYSPTGKSGEEIHFNRYASSSAPATAKLIPLSHFMEEWNDGYTYDGHLVLAQKIIEPLFATHGVNDWLFFLSEGKFPKTEDIFEFWQERFSWSPKELKTVLSSGQIHHRLAPKTSPTVQWERLAGKLNRQKEVQGKIELNLRPDPRIGLGEYRHNEWLQELPKPLTALTWGNALLMAEETMKEKGWENGRLIRLTTTDGDEFTLPALAAPLHPTESFSTYLGHGDLPKHLKKWSVPIHEATATDRTEKPALAQTYFEPHDQHTAIELRRDELDHLPSHLTSKQQLYAEQQDKVIDSTLLRRMQQNNLRWAMAIDLNKCIGCGSCTIACQAENNIPAVGRKQVLMGREMHWIRVDRYQHSENGQARVVFQPVPCMHCEKAPCEEVCPVAATMHTVDGLNAMIYNRCIGTRFCANNCPYKVRRFNYSGYSVNAGSPRQWQYNPEVSVRPRGVMEKCTYCVQRIEQKKIEAKIADKPLKSIVVETACQTACPSRAIEFGNLADPVSQVNCWREDRRHYALLAELGTLPRTTYLAKVVNLDDSFIGEKK